MYLFLDMVRRIYFYACCTHRQLPITTNQPTHHLAAVLLSCLMESLRVVYNRYEDFLRRFVYLLQEVSYKFGLKFPDAPVLNTAPFY
jgi:hypothetical protein